MHPDAFDWLIIATVIAALFGLVKVAYDLGREDGWDEAGRWADDHIGPTYLSTLDGELAATRHDAEGVSDRRYPYRGEVE